MVEAEFLRLKSVGRIYFGQDNSSQPQVIRYLDEVDGLTPWTWLPHEEVGHTDEAKKELYELLGAGTTFETPKPVRLMSRLLQMASRQKDFIVLDFFAGSGTTAHAVALANSEDGGTRRCITVQLDEAVEGDPDTTIATLSRARLRKANEQIVRDRAAKELRICHAGQHDVARIHCIAGYFLRSGAPDDALADRCISRHTDGPPSAPWRVVAMRVPLPSLGRRIRWLR